MKRPVIYVGKHPLSNKHGAVRESRFVLYQKLKGIPGNCNWCGISLNWKTLCADHLDSNTENNSSDNLVGSCRGCNANRSDGTGYGRKIPKLCPVCKESFISKSHHKRQIFCSNKCARIMQPKRLSKSKHGTRTKYVQGCRCFDCKAANTSYSRKIYARPVAVMVTIK